MQICALKLVFQIYERFDKAISREIHQELSDRLREELDYEREAANLKLYRLMLAEEKSVNIPEAVPELLAQQLLTMTWLEGHKLLDWLANEPSQEQRNQVAMNMFRAWYVPFLLLWGYSRRPHLGNYSIDKKFKH